MWTSLKPENSPKTPLSHITLLFGPLRSSFNLFAQDSCWSRSDTESILTRMPSARPILPFAMKMPEVDCAPVMRIFSNVILLFHTIRDPVRPNLILLENRVKETLKHSIYKHFLRKYFRKIYVVLPFYNIKIYFFDHIS